MKVSERRVRVKTIDRVVCTHCMQVFTREMSKHNYGRSYLTQFGKAVAKWKRQHRCAEKQNFIDFFFLPTGATNCGCAHYRRPSNIIESCIPTCIYPCNSSGHCTPDTCPRRYHEEATSKTSS